MLAISNAIAQILRVGYWLPCRTVKTSDWIKCPLSWGGTALTGRDITPDLKTLTDTTDTNLFSSNMSRNETEIALGASKLFGGYGIAQAAAGKYIALKLSNPNGSGVTLRLKRITIFSTVLCTFGFFIDGAPTNVGAATAGLNRKQSGSAAQSTIAASNDAGAQPAMTGSVGGFTLAANGTIALDFALQLPANHSVTIWAGTVAATVGVEFEWIEY